jgi:hypothetical protein
MQNKISNMCGKFQKFKTDFQRWFSLSRTALVNIFSVVVICLSQQPLKMCFLEAIALPKPSLESYNIATTHENRFSRAILLLQPSLIMPFFKGGYRNGTAPRNAFLGTARGPYWKRPDVRR